MELFVNYSIFILILLLPLVFFALLVRKVPGLKMRDALPWLGKIEEIKDYMSVSPVDGEDMVNIKRAVSHSVGILTGAVFIDILAIAGLIGIVRTEEIRAVYILLYITVLALLNAVCLYKGIADRQVFQDRDTFDKRKGVLLRSKAVYYRRRKPVFYRVLIGTYDNEGNPVVFIGGIPDFVFWAMERNDKWSVVMYKGRPAALIKG